jgi:hypothetical protein
VIDTLKQVKTLVSHGEVRISDHGYDELAEDNIFVRDIVSGLENALLIEDYPDYPKGACVLVFQLDRNGQPLHAVWGIPRGEKSPAVLVTAYRPDPAKWSEDFRSRKT